MFLGILTLLTALAISGVAVYYSVSGLAAIFSGAAIPIIIMGASLEIGKLVTASWLHRNWKTAPFVLKSYLMIATVVLMFITSMGIFGFLSRAHVEQGAPIGDVAAQIELIDEKISAKRQEIEQAKTALKNLDNVVDQFMAKGRDERSVAAANNARKQQQAERNKTTKSIEDAQVEISKLQEKKLPLTTQIRKIETEVGPIKYIAEFMYGSNADKSMLEKAVTWMILTIIFVFDPLAVLLLIAGQISITQSLKKPEEVVVTEQPVVHDEHKNEIHMDLHVHADTHVAEDPKPVIDQDLIDKIVRERYAEMMKQVEKGEITFEGDVEEKTDVLADARNDDKIPTDTVDEEPSEPVRIDDSVVSIASESMADSEQPINTPIEDPKVEDNTARWQELEEQVANLKKKEEYMMKQGDKQVIVPKKI
jgi:hypothetical protein